MGAPCRVMLKVGNGPGERRGKGRIVQRKRRTEDGKEREIKGRKQVSERERSGG